MKTQTIKTQIMRVIFFLSFFCFSIVKAQIVNIPDSSFKNFLLTNYALNSANNEIPIDMNGDNEIQYSEALNIYSMPVIQGTSPSIMSFIGLEAFQNLRFLTIYWSTATTLDLSNLINLQSVELKWNANLSNLNVNGLTNLAYLTCNNNAISTLDLSTNSSLNTVFCDNNNITNINFGTQNSLINLQCDSNQISILDVSNLINLKYLKCSWNHISSLAIANLILLEELNCSTNSISSLDLSNLINLKKLYCGNNQLSAISLNSLSLLNDFNCEHNQLTSLDIMNNNNLVTLYCSGNLFTNLNVTALTNLHTLVADSCPITTLDVSNSTSLTNLYVGGIQLQSLFMKNGSNENLYLYYSPNLQYICADATEIPTTLTTVANNASTSTVVNTYCSFTPGGTYNTITGTIRYDSNNNGCDTLDPVFPNVRVDMQQWGSTNATMSNSNGIYTFYTTFADQSLSLNLENPSYFNVSPQNPTVSFNETNFLTAHQDFCLTSNGNHMDLDVTIQPLTVARPGFDATYKLVYRNKGNMIPGFNSGVRFDYNPNQMSYVSSSQAIGTQGTNYIVFDYSNLMPFETRSIIVTFHINAPTNSNPVTIGDVLHLHANVGLNIGDVATADNDFYYNQVVVGAYDPNEITCLEGDNLPTSEIGKYLHYGITFENTGNYYAENVVVKEVIDITKYDINSIQLLDTSHPVYTRITGNVVEFIFKNINLAAADGNPPVGGHGDVLFKIKSLSNLVNGDVVTKSAKIYFDYNAPIDTNAAQTTYQNLNNSVHQLDSSISVYPNPTNSFITINCSSNIKSIELYDVQGRILETSIENSTSAKLDISEKQNGTYFLKINTENGSKVEKIAKE